MLPSFVIQQPKIAQLHASYIISPTAELGVNWHHIKTGHCQMEKESNVIEISSDDEDTKVLPMLLHSMTLIIIGRTNKTVASNHRSLPPKGQVNTNLRVLLFNFS